MKKKQLLLFLLTLVCNEIFSQPDGIRFYTDFDLLQFKGVNEISKDAIDTCVRYLKIEYKGSDIKKMVIYNTVNRKVRQRFKLNVSSDHGFPVIVFGKFVAPTYEGNWFVFKGKKKWKVKWLKRNDSLFIISASIYKINGASLSVTDFSKSNVLTYNWYSLCCLDVDLNKTNTLFGVDYLLDMVNHNAKITFTTNRIDVNSFMWIDCETNLVSPHVGCDEGKTINRFLQSSGKSKLI